MIALTPAERRGALVLVGLLLIGAAHDLWNVARSRRPGPPSAGPSAGPAAIEDTLAPPGPADEDAPAPRPAVGAETAPPAVARPLDLNRADARALDRLPGVGPVLAERIVQQRRRFGPYRDLDELLAVRGIGPRLLGRLRPLLIVRAPDPPGGIHGGRGGRDDSLDVHFAR